MSEYHAVKNGKTYCVYAEKDKPSPELTAQLKKAGYKIKEVKT